MTEQGERYDRMAAGYERWWAPVLAPSARRLLDRLDAALATSRLETVEAVDIGAGTGNLTLAALERWPRARVTAIDASREMLATLDEAAAAHEGDFGGRLTSRVAYAAELPFGERSFDLAMSSFVLQLVPNRAKALREIRRVLRPGGTLGYVTWLADRTAFAPDRVFDTLLAEFGFEDEEGGDERSGDPPSVATAAAELRRAGFRDVAAEAERLEYGFSVESYIGFLVEFDEESLFDEMPRAERHRFLARLRADLMALPPDELVFRAPIVYATGRRSDG